MCRASLLWKIREMRFEDIYGRYQHGRLSQVEAAEILGVSDRTFRRWQCRYEADGAEGLYDRRLGRVSQRRAPIDDVMRLLELFDTHYSTYNTRHLYEHLVERHEFTRSYNWVRLTLQHHGRIKPTRHGGVHRRKRERRPMIGMMLHQDGSSHEWVPGQWWDLIVTMDDATSEIMSMFFVKEEGTMSSFMGVAEVIRQRGLFSSLYTDRGSHYWHTPKVGGKVDKSNPTQFGRALQQLGITMIPAYSPEARGRSERMFATLQGRLPQELATAGITDMAAANAFIRTVYLPRHNKKMQKSAAELGSAFVAFVGEINDILCVQEDRVVASDNTVRWKNLTLQIPAQQHRHHYVKSTVRVHHYPDDTLAIFHGPRCLVRYTNSGKIIDDQQVKNVAA